MLLMRRELNLRFPGKLCGPRAERSSGTLSGAIIASASSLHACLPSAATVDLIVVFAVANIVGVPWTESNLAGTTTIALIVIAAMKTAVNPNAARGVEWS
jgi:hypothetical protein